MVATRKRATAVLSGARSLATASDPRKPAPMARALCAYAFRVWLAQHDEAQRSDGTPSTFSTWLHVLVTVASVGLCAASSPQSRTQLFIGRL